jgi:hypothetical protein
MKVQNGSLLLEFLVRNTNHFAIRPEFRHPIFGGGIDGSGIVDKVVNFWRKLLQFVKDALQRTSC